MFLTATAEAYTDNPVVTTLLQKIAVNIINPIIIFLFGLALLFFLWGTFQYFLNGSDAAARKTGAQHILWGLIGMAIMFSVYGIIDVITGTINSI